MEVQEHANATETLDKGWQDEVEEEYARHRGRGAVHREVNVGIMPSA